jgi:hypothetical protein
MKGKEQIDPHSPLSKECVMNTSDRPSFAGWHRPSASSPWRRIVEAEGEDECWAMLLAASEGGDVTVLPSHCDPNRRKTSDMNLRLSL